jgi:hypothetical protein
VPVLGGVKGIKILDSQWAKAMPEEEIEAMLDDRY